MAKLDIDFTLLDESVVRYGFRALMSGGDLEEFKANPVMLLQHNRPTSYAGKDDIMLPIGCWYDIRIEGNKLLAKPDFDDDDELAQRVQKKVEKKYLNAVSVCIDPVAVSDDPALMLAGQTLPTFTKWGILESSIVDIPNCKNALAIRNSAGNRIMLSGTPDQETVDYLKTLSTNNTMDRKLLCAKLGLDENATDAQISDALVAVKLAAANGTELSTENATLKAEVIRLKAEQETAKIESLVDGAIEGMKLTAGDREKYIKLAKADFDTTKEVLDGMKPYQSIETQLSGDNAPNAAELEGMLKLSGKDLYMQGKLERLQAISPEQFKLKYKEAFGVEFPAAGK